MLYEVITLLAIDPEATARVRGQDVPLTWHAETQSKSRSLQIVVSARNGETHIRGEERNNFV